MLRALTLLLPALIPSWRFFKDVGPSPRIELRGAGGIWQDLSPRLARRSFAQVLLHLLWNPIWNEYLYLVTCSERLVADSSAQAQAVFTDRALSFSEYKPGTWVELRIRFVEPSSQGAGEAIVFETMAQVP
jgi:hypothetical protein